MMIVMMTMMIMMMIMMVMKIIIMMTILMMITIMMMMMMMNLSHTGGMAQVGLLIWTRPDVMDNHDFDCVMIDYVYVDDDYLNVCVDCCNEGYSFRQ